MALFEGNAGSKEGKSLSYAQVARKVDNSLKPQEPLGSKFYFSEFKAWLGSIKAFFKANKFEQEPMDVQLYHLRSCMHHDMQSWLDGQMADNPDLTVDGEYGCFEKIQKYFEEEFKLVRRRFDFFTYKRSPNQSIKEFILQQETLAREAELSNMKAEDIKIMCLTAGVNDAQTRKELFKLPEGSSWEDYKKIALLQESASVNEKHFGGTVSIAAMKKSSYRSAKEQRLKDQVRHAKLTCFNCDEVGHISRNCLKPRNPKKICAAIRAEYDSAVSDNEEQSHKMRSVRVRAVKSNERGSSFSSDGSIDSSETIASDVSRSECYMKDKIKVCAGIKSPPSQLVNGMEKGDFVDIEHPNEKIHGKIKLLRNRYSCFVETNSGMRVYNYERLSPCQCNAT